MINASRCLYQLLAFPEWSTTMNTWGGLMKTAVTTLTEMVAVGLDLPHDAFTNYTKYGPHLLAPTGSDLGKNGNLDTVLAGKPIIVLDQTQH